MRFLVRNPGRALLALALRVAVLPAAGGESLVADNPHSAILGFVSQGKGVQVESVHAHVSSDLSWSVPSGAEMLPDSKALEMARFDALAAPELGQARMGDGLERSHCRMLAEILPPETCTRDLAYAEPDVGGDFIPPGFLELRRRAARTVALLELEEHRVSLGRGLANCYRDASILPEECEDEWVRAWQSLEAQRGAGWGPVLRADVLGMLENLQRHLAELRLARIEAPWFGGGPALRSASSPVLDPFHALFKEAVAYQRCWRWHRAWDQNMCAELAEDAQ